MLFGANGSYAIIGVFRAKAQSMKKIIKAIVPKFTIRFVQNIIYYSQSTQKISYAGFILEVPRKHLLIGISNNKNSIRDQCIGISAKYTALRYEDCSIVDIGANIGDTAAILASYVKNKLILVEASTYFYRLLKKNSTQFSNNVDIINAFILDGTQAKGSLVHWGGTAYYDTDAQNFKTVRSLNLEDVADNKTKFVKIDADGCDNQIILSSLSFISKQKPLLFFEEMIRNSKDLLDANSVIDALAVLSYGYFILWDQDGNYLLSTSNLSEVKDRLDSLFKIWTTESNKTIYNYEILAIPDDDSTIFEQISAHYSAND